MSAETAMVPAAEPRELQAYIEHAPALVLAEARKAAEALRDVIGAKKDKVVFNNQQYLEFEDWQLLGRFYGITCAEVGEPEFVDYGPDVKGFKAHSVALLRSGNAVLEISRATAFCLSDEEKWNSRPKYVWGYVTTDGTWSAEDPGRDNIVWEDNPYKPGKQRPKKERRQVGDEKVPLFQLASMAQTRANAKALSNTLRWVAVLAGFQATPAEELPVVQAANESASEVFVSPTPHAEPTMPVRGNGEAKAAPAPPVGLPPSQAPDNRPACPKCHGWRGVMESKYRNNGAWYCKVCKFAFGPKEQDERAAGVSDGNVPF